MSKIRKVFSKNLKRIREEKGFTQEMLAERMEISVRYIQQLEGKNCPNVKIETIEGLARKLKVKPYEFLVG